MRHALVIITILLLGSVNLVGQDDSGRKFVKIIHSADMTVAADSAGQTWRYDAESGEFTPSRVSDWAKASQASGSRQDDYGDEDVILPPEIRCTNIIDGDISNLLDDVMVEIDERVEGKIVCGRDVTVKGLVTGDIICGQTVLVESTGEVRGDVIAREIRRERGGRILGQRQEIPFFDITRVGLPRVTPAGEGVASIFVMAFLVFICLIVIALTPRFVNNIVERIELELVKSFFWGLLAWFLILPIMVLLIITIVGIPIALIVLPLALIVGQILAYVSISLVIGKMIAPRLGLPTQSVYMLSIYGVMALNLLLLLANAGGMVGADVLSILGFVFFGIINFAAVTTGFGAVITTRFGTRRLPAAMGPDTEPPVPVPEVVPPAPPVAPPPPQSDTSPPPPPVPPPPPA